LSCFMPLLIFHAKEKSELNFLSSPSFRTDRLWDHARNRLKSHLSTGTRQTWNHRIELEVSRALSKLLGKFCGTQAGSRSDYRLMLGSACLPAIIVCIQVFFTPESPRWLIGRGEHRKAYDSLLRLRRSPIQAAIDLYGTETSLFVPLRADARVGSQVSRNPSRSKQKSKQRNLATESLSCSWSRGTDELYSLQQFSCSVNVS